MGDVIGFGVFALLLWLVYLLLRWALAVVVVVGVVVAAVLGVPRYMDHLERQFILGHTHSGGTLIVVPQSRKAYFIHAG